MAPKLLSRIANAFRLPGSGTPSYEAAGHGRRLRGFNPSKNHVNTAIAAAGPTLLARARWLYENESMAGNGIDEWVSAAVGDGIKPRPRKGTKPQKRALIDLFWRWTEEADSEGMTDYYGLQEKIAREVRIAGECFVRLRSRRPGDMYTVPFQLQVLPSEMLDISYDVPLSGGNYIRMGIEFNAIGKRVAYHFFRYHPYDARPPLTANLKERVRVPAEEVIHVIESRQAGQIRGVPTLARVLVKIFGLEVYDDAELERKKTAALFTGFLIGRGESPISLDNDDDDDDDAPIAGMEPGAIVDLGDDKDIKFSGPTEVGGSYEAFQYRTALKISAGTGVPYAYVTGDMVRGNFSNVRTDIIRFRRRVSQWQNNTLIFQLCRPVWVAFIERAVMAGLIELSDYDENPTTWWACNHLPPRQEWIDPAKDVAAEKEAVKAGFKSRTQVVAERGYDREEVDDEIEEEQKDETARKLIFDTNVSKVKPPSPGAPIGNTSAAKGVDEGEEEEEEEELDDAA